MGNQGTAAGPFRRALELIRDGTLGEIKEVHIWNDGGGADRKEPPKGEEPVPEYLKWDLWLGPAASRPYHHEWLQCISGETSGRANSATGHRTRPTWLSCRSRSTICGWASRADHPGR